MPIFKHKNGYRLKYQYDLLQELLGIKRGSVRKKMNRKGLGNETSDFVEFIKTIFKK